MYKLYRRLIDHFFFIIIVNMSIMLYHLAFSPFFFLSGLLTVHIFVSFSFLQVIIIIPPTPRCHCAFQICCKTLLFFLLVCFCSIGKFFET
ncbi:hypothetical protein EDC94DRAFT_621403 [Helicostylum pulchrum]|nr:hypothetical protein EDC94DRAFT_621403 [Helicostylum pulchrum]